MQSVWPLAHCAQGLASGLDGCPTCGECGQSEPSSWLPRRAQSLKSGHFLGFSRSVTYFYDPSLPAWRWRAHEQQQDGPEQRQLCLALFLRLPALLYVSMHVHSDLCACCVASAPVGSQLSLTSPLTAAMPCGACRLQPVKETRDKQSSLWGSLILGYCKHNKVGPAHRQRTSQSMPQPP